MTTVNPVLLPMVRNAMPNIIAHQIIGVQPMTGPTASINMLRVRYATNGWRGRVVMDKLHYHHFTRVYNRRRYHHPEYLSKLGYTHFKFTLRSTEADDMEAWCKDHLKPGSWVRSYVDFWFAYKDDAAMYAMRWS